MNRSISLLGALVLVLMLWTGGTAHTGERFETFPVTAESAHHFDRVHDHSPRSPGQSESTHHGGYDGHHLAVPADAKPIELRGSAGEMPIGRQPRLRRDHQPGLALRPPIA